MLYVVYVWLFNVWFCVILLYVMCSFMSPVDLLRMVFIFWCAYIGIVICEFCSVGLFICVLKYVVV